MEDQGGSSETYDGGNSGSCDLGAVETGAANLARHIGIVATATAPSGFPIAMPIASGTATARALRDAIHLLLILLLSIWVTVRQKAAM